MRNFWLSTFVFLSYALFHVGMAHAASEVLPKVVMTQSQATHPEKLLLLYYKLSGKEPPLQAWVAQSPFLQGAIDSDKNVIMAREEARLKEVAAMQSPTDVINVHTKINLNNYSTLQGKLFLAEFNEKTFFNYSIYGENVAIVPQDIKNFSEIDIPKTQMEEILRKNPRTEVTAEIILQPLHADKETPFVFENKNYWLLLARIAEIRFWSNATEPVLLWRYKADWYQPAGNKKLLELKKDGT